MKRHGSILLLLIIGLAGCADRKDSGPVVLAPPSDGTDRILYQRAERFLELCENAADVTEELRISANGQVNNQQENGR